jgi:hypothetical protein
MGRRIPARQKKILRQQQQIHGSDAGYQIQACRVHDDDEDEDDDELTW